MRCCTACCPKSATCKTVKLLSSPCACMPSGRTFCICKVDCLPLGCACWQADPSAYKCGLVPILMQLHCCRDTCKKVTWSWDLPSRTGFYGGTLLLEQCDPFHQIWSDVHYDGTPECIGHTFSLEITDGCGTALGAIAMGVGTKLKELIQSLGGTEHVGCQCEALVHEMDTKGHEWCWDSRYMISATLRKNVKKQTFGTKLLAGVRAASQLTWLNPLDPAPDMFDEAFRRHVADEPHLADDPRWRHIL